MISKAVLLLSLVATAAVTSTTLLKDSTETISLESDDCSTKIIGKSDCRDYTKTASLGTLQTSSKYGRTKYTSQSVYDVLPNRYLVNHNRKNTLFVNCGDKLSSSGFFLDVKPYLSSRPKDTFSQFEKSEIERGQRSD